MNILLKSFDGPYCKQIVERTFRDHHLNKCFSILNSTEQMATIDADTHVWIPATPLREGRYENVDWNTITPLDAALVEQMEHCESVFLMMLERYAKRSDMPYGERKRQYLQHLRYWNHFLNEEHIDLFLSNHVPHQCYDYVIYCLCKIKSIPTLYLERCFVVDGFYVVKDLEKSAEELPQAMEAARKTYGSTKEPIPLSATFEESIRLVLREEDAMGKAMREKNLLKKNFFMKWWKIALRMFIKKPRVFLKSVLSSEFWTRKWQQHRVFRLYDDNIKTPDLSQPYLYFPLHFQPEATTCPMAGIFMHQELIVEMLAKHLPPHVKIYIKEHPAQGEACRSDDFYQSLLDIPAVTFVPRDSNSFALMKHSLGVITATGTAGFEALFHGKPTVMFGYRFFQYAPGIRCVHTDEDCQQVIQHIMRGNAAPSPHDMRLFLKAVEDSTAPFVHGPKIPGKSYDENERAEAMGTYIAAKLEPFFIEQKQ